MTEFTKFYKYKDEYLHAGELALLTDKDYPVSPSAMRGRLRTHTPEHAVAMGKSKLSDTQEPKKRKPKVKEVMQVDMSDDFNEWQEGLEQERRVANFLASGMGNDEILIKESLRRQASM